MEEGLLNTFIAVSECGSLSRAAEKLFISSTAVMKQINRLERETGVALFARSGRGMALTEAGRSLYADAKSAVRFWEEAVGRARNIEAGQSTAVRIGNSLLNPCKPLLDLWNSAVGDKPNCKLQIIPFTDTVEELDRIYHTMGKTFDVMFGACDINDYSDYFQILNAGTYKLCVGIPAGHRLENKRYLEPHDLSGERLIVLRPGTSGILDNIRRYLLKNCPQIQIEDSPQYYDFDVFNRCEREKILLLTLDAWSDVHPSIRTVPINLDFAIPRGVMYPLQPSDAVHTFIKTIETALSAGR